MGLLLAYTGPRQGDGTGWVIIAAHAWSWPYTCSTLSSHVQVKALSEELENPLNVHRWRKLEGSDPSTYEMIQKIQTLQKRLIAKTEEVVEKDLLIQEKEKLYMELKNILARQPGPEVAEQLSIYQVCGGCWRCGWSVTLAAGLLVAVWYDSPAVFAHSDGSLNVLLKRLLTHCPVFIALAGEPAGKDKADEGNGQRAQHVPGTSERVQVRDRAPGARAERHEAQVL